ncbi:MAG: YceI family protein [Candidatus Eisenbacteria bacterium]|nr:YceI family protein [Candidatus Eisenbacteria bacterium]
MKRRTLVRTLTTLGLAAAVSAQAAPVSYRIDPSHSEVGFTIRHLVSKVHGNFAKFKGTFTYDAANLAASSVTVEIPTASINTGVERRDNHLRSADFFAADSFPTITFASKSVKPLGKDSFEFTGDLTMRGVTRPVTLTANVLGSGPGADGVGRMGFEAVGKLNRKDFGVLWNHQLDKGGFVLGDDVNLNITVEAIEGAAPAPAPAPQK